MKSTIERIALALVLAIGMFAASGRAAAEEGCAEKIIRARTAELGGMKVDRVEAAETGVLATFQTPGKKGLLMVGMTFAEADLVTFQGVFGREGGSNVSADESKWLTKLFDKLFPDAALKACPEIVRPVKPTSEAVFAAMQTWWKEQTQTDDKLSGQTQLPVILVAVAAVVLILALSVVIVVRRRRKAPKAGVSQPDGETVDAGPVADAVEEVPVDEGGAGAAEDPEEVL